MPLRLDNAKAPAPPENEWFAGDDWARSFDEVLDDCLPALHRTQCHRLLRAARMVQELLSTFGADLGEVTLAPRTGGVFEITCDDLTIWSARQMAAFPTSRS